MSGQEHEGRTRFSAVCMLSLADQKLNPCRSGLLLPPSSSSSPFATAFQKPCNFSNDFEIHEHSTVIEFSYLKW